MGVDFPYIDVACGEPRVVWRKSAPLFFNTLDYLTSLNYL